MLPTVNPSRVEEILIRVREVTSSKSQLEQENKELREKNFNLMLRNDYIENERVHIEAL